ncbi:hypothetical protein [Dactylosporangium matsuzakiense]|uniref:Uncharacterized protein n=1 Tax=Dactylosporangium matsuzakiense TaxID=53360 RepID=A0A9W6KLB7_9ACTN|nr:hypothetical protein [Dactylosporangium matsuzakiense]GLL01584.1 hypothetical protein GCM10017581_033260 [Dactylosporangium matsuzakiense]
MTTSTSPARPPQLVERAHHVGAERAQRFEAGRVPPGRDDLPGPELLGDLDGHPPGVPGRAEDQHLLSPVELDAPPQCHPRRHHGVHRRGDQDRVDPVGQHDAAVGLDDGPVGHGPERGVVEHGVADAALRVPHDGIDPGDQRQLPGARVVRPVRLGAGPRVQRGGEDVDDHLVPPARDRLGVLLVSGRVAERGDDSGVHDGSPFREVSS